MGFRKIFWVLSLGIGLLGCSNDDVATPEESDSKTPDFIVVGEDDTNIYEFNYTASAGDGQLINLTQENDVARQYLTLRQAEDLLTFYSFSSGSFTAIQKNLTTGNSIVIDNFYTSSSDRSIIWGTNSRDRIFLGYYSPRESRNFGVRSIDPVTLEFRDIPIEFNIQRVFQPLYVDNKLILLYLDQQNSYKVAVINTDSNGLIGTLDFGSVTPSIFIDQNGDMAVILGAGSSDYQYELIDLETLNTIQDKRFSLNNFFSPGPLEAYFADEKLFYLNLYVQPSPITFGPAVYDFITESNSVIDMIAIVQELEQDSQAKIELSAFYYDIDSRVFLMGYAKLDDAENLEGGVLVISPEGKRLETIPLTFAPTYFVK